MSSGSTARDLRVLASPAMGRRAVVAGSLALLERLLVPATAFAMFGQGLAIKLGTGLLLGTVFTARTFAQRAFASRTEAELLAATARSVLGGDLLRVSVLPHEDARLELGQGVYHASTTLSQTLPNLAADGMASLLLALFVAAREPPRLVALAAALTAVAAVGLLFSRRSVERSVKRATELQMKVYDAFVDALDGRLEIVAAGLRPRVVAELGRGAVVWGNAGAHVAGSTVLAGRIPILAIAGLVVVALTTGLGQAGWVPATMADVALFAAVTPAFAGIAQGTHALLLAQRWVHAVAEVLRSEKPPRPGRGVRREPPRRLAFEGVSFRYEGSRDDALRAIDLAWGEERVLALSGPNGSGKSTLLRLVLALADPTGGVVRVDDASLADLDADAWREHVAFLPQRPYLPARADVRRAVRWPADVASDEAITAALERVGLLPVLRRMGPEPLRVDVDSLSVGQRQRVALARLLCRDAWLVVLDEPDANLDRAGIALVADLTRELARDRRVLLAAHTEELLEAADRVVFLRDGRVQPARSEP